MPGYLLRPFRMRDAGSVPEPLDLVDWLMVAQAPDGSVAGWGSLRSWTEDDGVRVYLTHGHVRSRDRRRGLGGMLLDEAEAAAARLVAARRETATVMLGGNARDGDAGREALLLSRGYRRVFTMVRMLRDRSPVPVAPVPAGIRLRAATVADAGPLWHLMGRAWAGRPFVALPSQDRLRGWLHGSDRSSFRVAAAGDRIAGFVAVTGDEIEDLAVDPDFQRRGIASALLTRALAELGGPAWLRTEAHDPAGARTLYERLGFRVTESHHRYRKPLGGA